MDAYAAQAKIRNADGQLVAAVLTDVHTEGYQWSGVLTVKVGPIDWVSQDLTLHMEEQPAGPILVERAPTQAVGGVHLVHFIGSGLPPFWKCQPKAELLEELRKRRRPMAGARGPGGEPSAWNINVVRRIRAVLKDRDRLTDAEIDKAIES